MRVCDSKRGVCWRRERTGVGVRKEKEERRNGDAQGREWVGLDYVSPLAWSRPSIVV
jgi:hypothetical protein